MIYNFLKRTFDILVSSIGIIILIPLSLIIKISYILNKDYNTIFYTQKRIGKNGKTFKLYKYRTMVTNADEILKQLLKNPKIKQEYLNSYKIKNDPRLTKIGKLLRKTSIDEMPQFLNILKGDMSLIGPRPIIQNELKKYGKDKKKLLSIKPGLTGYWACHGRNKNTYKERIKLELYYVDNMSIILDIKIFFKTIISVIKKDGAI